MTSQQIRKILGVRKSEVAKCEKPAKLKGHSPWPVCSMDVRLEGDTDWWSELVMWVDPKGSVVRHLIVERYPPESIPDSVIWASVEADWGPPDSVRRFDSGKEMDRWWSSGDRFAMVDYSRTVGRTGASITYRIWNEPGYTQRLLRQRDSLERAVRNAAIADSIEARKAALSDAMFRRILSPSKHN